MRKTKIELQADLKDLKSRFDKVFEYYESARKNGKYWMDKYYQQTDITATAVFMVVVTNVTWIILSIL